MRLFISLVITLVVSLCIFAPQKAEADLIIVKPDGTGDYPTIQEAINEASDWDEIVLTNGTFTGDGNRDIDFLGKAITVRSQSGDPELCVIDCQASSSDEHRGFYFHYSETPASVVDGVTIRNAYARQTLSGGGAIYCIDASPTIVNCVMDDNYGGWGGGIRLKADNTNCSLTIDNCVFRANRSYDGGGALVLWGNALGYSASATITNCVFMDNTVQGYASAIWMSWSSPTQISNCSFSWEGGTTGIVVTLEYESSATLVNCTFMPSANVGIDVMGGNSATLSNCTIVGCRNGVRVHEGASVIIENSILAFNTELGVECYEADTITVPLNCCNLYGNGSGDYVGCIEDQEGINGNFSLDPLFCDTAGGNYHIYEASPCAPDNNSCQILIGALGVGCVNQLPTAYIDDISPNPGNEGEPVSFSGHGEDPDGYIAAHRWHSSVDEYLSSQSSFSTPNLSPGSHTIYFSVRDDYGEWSDSASTSLYINHKPEAFIDSIMPDSVEEGEAVYFGGHGTDVDGAISEYEWWSSIDEVLSASSSFTTDDLSYGVHTISFRVQDNNGLWSEKDFAELEVIPEDLAEVLIDALDCLKTTCSTKVHVMTTDLAQALAWSYKGIEGYDSEQYFKDLLNPTAHLPYVLSTLLGGISPASVFTHAVATTIKWYLKALRTQEDARWLKVTEYIFDDLNPSSESSVNDLRPIIETALFTYLDGPDIDQRITDIKAIIDEAITEVQLTGVPEGFPMEEVLGTINRLTSGIQNNDDTGERATLYWYNPYWHDGFPEDDGEVFLMHKLGDWRAGDPQENSFARCAESVYWDAKNKREVGQTAYWSCLAVGVGAGAVLVGKAVIAYFTFGLSLVSEAVIGLTLAGVAWDAGEIMDYSLNLQADHVLVEAASQSVGAYYEDLERLETIMGDTRWYVICTLLNCQEFPSGRLQLLDLLIPDILLDPGEVIDIVTGTATVKNVGDETAKVNLFAQVWPLTRGDLLSITGPREFVELSPGQEATIEFDLTAPDAYEIGRRREYYLAIPRFACGTRWGFSLGPGYSLAEFYSDMRFWVGPASKFGYFDPPLVTIVAADSVLQEQTSTSQHTASDYQTVFRLEFDDADLDLHLYDNVGNHTGLDYGTGEVEEQIPSSEYDPSSEAITVYEATGSEYTIEVMGKMTVGYAPFTVVAFESSERPAIINIAGVGEHIISQPDDTVNVVVPINEGGGHHVAVGVELTASDFVGSSYTIPSSNISFDSVATEIPAGNLMTSVMAIHIPPDAPADEYTGDVTVTSTNGGSDQINLTLHVENPPAVPSTPSGPVSGYTDTAYTYTTSTTDPESDSLYYIFDWDDGTPDDWYGPLASGASCSVPHTWAIPDTHCVRVRAADTWGQTSDWSDSLAVFIEAVPFIRGDANADMEVQMVDAIFTLKHLYVPGSDEPSCMRTADSDDSGDIQMGDAIYTLKYLYVPGSPEPPAPFPDCGIDMTSDTLGCISHPCSGGKATVAKREKILGGKLVLDEPQIGAEEVVVSVHLNNKVDLAGFAYEVEYDPSVFDSASIQFDSLIVQSFDFFSAKPEKGKITVGNVVSLTMKKSLPPGGYHAADIVFNLATPNLDRTELRLTDVELVDTDANPLSCETQGTTIDRWLHLRMPKIFVLRQAFPNPFTGETSIRYQLPKASHVELKIYNSAGQLVSTLVNKEQKPGYYRVEWNGKDTGETKVASGVYFYRIEMSDYTATKKMILLR